MPTTINSLPPELILHILGFVAPDGDQDELDPARRSPKPEPNPLLATSLVNRRFGRLSQGTLFRKIHLNEPVQGLRWRDTAAGVNTREMTLAPKRTARVNGEAPARIVLAELLAPSEAHLSTGRETRLRALIIYWGDRVELGEQLSGTGALEGLVSLAINTPMPESCTIGPLPSLRHLYLDPFGRLGPPTITPLPALTHLSFFCPPPSTSRLDLAIFPLLRCLSVATFYPDVLTDLVDAFAAALATAPPLLAHFSTTGSLPEPVAQALPVTVTCLTLAPQRGANLRVVLDRWFSGRGSNEVGQLNRVVLLGLTEDEVVRYYARGAEFLERVAAAGCEVECRKEVRLDWRE